MHLSKPDKLHMTHDTPTESQILPMNLEALTVVSRRPSTIGDSGDGDNGGASSGGVSLWVTDVKGYRESEDVARGGSDLHVLRE